MSKSTSPYLRVSASATGTGVVSQAGAVLLLRPRLAPYRNPVARHDPGKIALDLATALATGGDCLADIVQLRAHPEIFGAVASDPTVSRLISVLAADTALAEIGRARATARSHAWAAAGTSAPDHAIDEAHPLVLDIDANLVPAHSENRPPRRSSEASVSIHCARSSTTPWAAPVNPSRCCCGRVTRGRIPPPILPEHCVQGGAPITVVQDALAQLPFDPAYRVGKRGCPELRGTNFGGGPVSIRLRLT